MDTPGISLLIVNYNYRTFLPACLDSIAAQTLKPVETIVVDDGSTDDSVSLEAEYPWVRWFALPHQGVAVARNTAIALARGDYLVFVDADDILHPQRLELQYQALRETPGAELNFCPMKNFIEADSLRARQVAAVQDIPCCVTMLASRRVYTRVGPFDEALQRGEDTEFLARLRIAKYAFPMMDGPALYLRRIHGTNLTMGQAPVQQDVFRLHALAGRRFLTRSRQPLVSMAIPCHNYSQYLPALIDSLAAQTYPHMQIVFVNDGSPDDTEQVLLEQFPKLFRRGYDVKYLRHETNLGQAAAMNTALPVMDGEYLTWMDADDTLHPESIEARVTFLQNNPEFGIVRTNGTVLVPGQEPVPLLKDKEPKEGDLFLNMITCKVNVYAGTYMVRTSLFDASYPQRQIPVSQEGQNLQMLVPPASRSLCGYIDRPLFCYHRHEGSHSVKAQSFAEKYARVMGFRKMFFDLLPYCAGDKDNIMAAIDTFTQNQTTTLRQNAIASARHSITNERK